MTVCGSFIDFLKWIFIFVKFIFIKIILYVGIWLKSQSLLKGLY